MERHLLELEAPGLHPPDELLRKVQPGGGGGHRPLELRVDGLVARVVNLLALAVQVGRYGDAAQRLEQLSEGHVGRPLEAHPLLAAPLSHAPGAQVLGAALVVEVDFDVPLLPLLEVAHDARPLAGALDGKGALVIGRLAGLQAEDLDASSRGFVHDDAGADDLRVVEDQQLPGGELLADVGEMALGNLAVTVDQQLRGAALGKRELGDALLGQVVVVAVDVDMSFHGGRVSLGFGGKDTQKMVKEIQKRDIGGCSGPAKGGQSAPPHTIRQPDGGHSRYFL